MNNLTLESEKKLTELVYFLCQDYCGISRGRGFPLAQLQHYLQKGIGWVPANLGLNPFGQIARNPWGSNGDLLLRGTPQDRVLVQIPYASTSLHYYLTDIMNLDGSPWNACPRTYLRNQIKELEKLGIVVRAGFEHEFMFTDASNHEPAFSLRAARIIETFGAHFIGALEQAGVEPSNFLPEYAFGQYEISFKHADALNAADRAVITRDILKEIARTCNRSLSLSPKVANRQGNNGVHVHLSLWDTNGNPLTYDAKSENTLTEVAGQFASGIVYHMRALCALTAPGVVSYQRLKPQQWSSAYTCMGLRNREASLRIAPINTVNASNEDCARQANFEYRPADSLASPYIVLGALLAAGIDGIRKKHPIVPVINNDPSLLSQAEKEKLGVNVLPSSLEEALLWLEKDEVLKASMSKEMFDCYLAVKRTEIEFCKGKTETDIAMLYQQVY